MCCSFPVFVSQDSPHSPVLSFMADCTGVSSSVVIVALCASLQKVINLIRLLVDLLVKRYNQIIDYDDDDGVDDDVDGGDDDDYDAYDGGNGYTNDDDDYDDGGDDDDDDD